VKKKVKMDTKRTDIKHKVQSVSSGERIPIQIKIQGNRERESTNFAFHLTIISFAIYRVLHCLGFLKMFLQIILVNYSEKKKLNGFS
jgi:hypothetical protein